MSTPKPNMYTLTVSTAYRESPDERSGTPIAQVTGFGETLRGAIANLRVEYARRVVEADLGLLAAQTGLDELAECFPEEESP